MTTDRQLLEQALVALMGAWESDKYHAETWAQIKDSITKIRLQLASAAQPDPVKTHTINRSGDAAVSLDCYWIPITKETPRSVRVLMLGKGGVAAIGVISTCPDLFWTHWSPLPKRRS